MVGCTVACARVVASDRVCSGTETRRGGHASADCAGKHNPVQFKYIAANEETRHDGNRTDGKTYKCKRNAGTCKRINSTVAVIKTDNRKEECKAEFADNCKDFRVHAERKRADFSDIAQNQRADQNASCRFEADIAERAHVYFD